MLLTGQLGVTTSTLETGQSRDEGVAHLVGPEFSPLHHINMVWWNKTPPPQHPRGRQEGQRSEVQGHPWLSSVFMARLGYMRS